MSPISPSGGGSRRPLLKRDIENAQQNTISHRQAAQYLNSSFTTYKRYAKAYGLYDTAFKNPAGRGVKKTRRKQAWGLDEILDGRRPNYDRTRLKERLIESGMLAQTCRYCGFHEVKLDGRGPFVLTYNDDNKNNLNLSNLSLTCYNCYYLTTGRLSKNILTPSTPTILPEERDLDSQGITWEDMKDEFHEITQDDHDES